MIDESITLDEEAIRLKEEKKCLDELQKKRSSILMGMEDDMIRDESMSKEE